MVFVLMGCCEGGIRTRDLWVMSPSSYLCSTSLMDTFVVSPLATMISRNLFCLLNPILISSFQILLCNSHNPTVSHPLPCSTLSPQILQVFVLSLVFQSHPGFVVMLMVKIFKLIVFPVAGSSAAARLAKPVPSLSSRNFYSSYVWDLEGSVAFGVHSPGSRR